MTPSLGLIILLEQLTELRETLMFTSLLKGMIKDTDEHPGGRDVQGNKACGKGHGASLPCPGSPLS